jgi:hypothetical protein
MVPLVGVPETIRRGLAPYREVFCRAEGFDHVSRYVTGLLLSPNKTLRGLYDAQVWEPGAPRSRRAMHEAGSCTPLLRIIPSAQKPGTMPHLTTL